MYLREKHKIHQTETTTRGKEISAQEVKKALLRNSKGQDCQKIYIKIYFGVNIVNILNFKGKESYKQN